MLLLKSKPWRSEAYRRFVASMPCCACGRSPSNAHHENERGKSTMGGKTCDSRTLPLCPVCHFERHAKGREVWQRWGVDPEAVIERMRGEWKRKGNMAGWE